ncbi:MAG TPA: ATP F0F1 synthase subunit B [Methylocella sp.]|nr:ATP F0F1 synthase subunit B [Methylocella sp.]
MFDPEFVVALGFAVFVGLMIYLGMHRKIAAALDKRSARIEAELAEAARLRAEAAALLASFERRSAEAQAEAEAIVAQAHAEAERIASEARARMTEFVQRRTKQAEEKIRLAETQAAAEVRAAAADAAVKAAEIVLRGEAQGAFGETLIERGIADLKATLQ